MNNNIEGKALKSHSHAISDITSLQSILDSKASNSHSHAISDITNLQTTLDGKAATNHTHEYLPLSGGLMTGSIFMGNNNCFIGYTSHDGIGLDKQNNINIRTWYGLSIDSTCDGQTTPSISFDARSGDMYLRGKIKPNHSDVHPNFNADMLDGSHSSEFRKNQSGFIGNFNTAFVQSEYGTACPQGTAGEPIQNNGINWGKLVTYVSTGDAYNGKNNWLWQFYMGTNGVLTYRQKINDGAFTSWAAIATLDSQPVNVQNSAPGLAGNICPGTGRILWAW